ncbi:hypothetical protein NEUTE1DRAFT_141679 [Neurospora tetrasperma FGSC 2508]|uniref:Uncharacterized protein n=1 Tax=Neurospora tetrasperma (strain FGSC 2508 / ATCC MYA-4615 / P0657) TaxID=510951 RepID=F8N3F1_NEUT8|nr:uncharacterized protein NEUTE1DRAFT_141679 [Neurospora tetrasperma FGSC 2508]EGO51758.1 hypothetical protein NEUTE1DRAFT_141679 [Neurospora tetrasperma FGSC 2508]
MYTFANSRSSHIRAATPFPDLPYRETRTDRVINYENELLLMAPLQQQQQQQGRR